MGDQLRGGGVPPDNPVDDCNNYTYVASKPVFIGKLSNAIRKEFPTLTPSQETKLSIEQLAESIRDEYLKADH